MPDSEKENQTITSIQQVSSSEKSKTLLSFHTLYVTVTFICLTRGFI